MTAPKVVIAETGTAWLDDAVMSGETLVVAQTSTESSSQFLRRVRKRLTEVAASGASGVVYLTKERHLHEHVKSTMTKLASRVGAMLDVRVDAAAMAQS